MAIAGLVTGIAAIGMTIWGMVIVFSGLNSLSNDLNSGAAAQPAAVHQEAHLIHQGWFVGNS